MRFVVAGGVVLALAGATAAADELPRFRVGVEGVVTLGDAAGGQLGSTGDLRIEEPLVVRARIGYGRLEPNYADDDASDASQILRFELGVELRKRHEMHAFFAGVHGGVQRMWDGWIAEPYYDIPWAPLFGGQFGFEVYRDRFALRAAFDISKWWFTGESGTEYGVIGELAYSL